MEEEWVEEIEEKGIEKDEMKKKIRENIRYEGKEKDI